MICSDDLEGSDAEDVDDIDEELALPELLANIGLKEKRELLEFKRTHNEVSYLIYSNVRGVIINVGSCQNPRFTPSEE
jgi:hypothetical protein